MSTDTRNYSKEEIMRQAQQAGQIKTGLKLSEAIKYCEDNHGALIMPDGGAGFKSLSAWILFCDITYSVKPPPPKSVVVTQTILAEAWEKANASRGELFKNVCKELGL